MTKMPTKQLKVGLRVRDLDRSFDLYRRLGFRHLPQPEQTHLRYLTYGHTWLILSDLHQHGYHHVERGPSFPATIQTAALRSKLYGQVTSR